MNGVTGQRLLEAYPLAWPEQRPRTSPGRRRPSRFEVSFASARDHLLGELSRLHVLVHFSTHTSDHHAVKNTLSLLRKSGFEWPPPAKVAAEPVAPPNRYSDIEPACAPPSETAGERLERLCRELTEAWGYVALADENLLERREQMEAALRGYQGAEAEHSSAVARFKETKKALDAAVELTPTVGTKSLTQ